MTGDKVSFTELDQHLHQYFNLFVTAIDPEYSGDVRQDAKRLVSDQSLWQSFIKTTDEEDDSALPNRALKEYPQLYLLNTLTEVLLAQLIPMESLKQNKLPFAQSLHLWFMKSWLLQYSEQHYPNEFQMLLEFLSRLLKPYDAHAGRTFDHVIDEFGELLIKVVESQADPQHYVDLQHQLTGVYQAFQKKILPFEQRVIAFEKQQHENQTASDDAKQLIKSTLQQHRIPKWVNVFISEHWHRLFHLILLKNDSPDEALNAGTSLLSELLDSFKLLTAEEVQQAFASTISPLRSQIRELFSSIVIDDAVMDSFLDRLEQHHIDIMEGKALPENEWVSFGSNEIKSSDSVKETYKQVILHCKSGSWFNYHLPDKSLHCRVIDRNMSYQKLVLVNYSGVRVDSLSFKVANDLIETEKLKPFSLHSELEQKLGELSNYIGAQVQAINKQLTDKQKQQQKRKLLARLEASRKERLEIKKSKRQAEKRAREKAILQKQAEQKQSIIEQLKLLAPGSTFIDHANDATLIKFVLRLKQTGKLVFVNKRGVKVAQWLPEEMATLMVDGKLELLASQQSNEQTMEQIVAAQRLKRQAVSTS
ncbi:DUF1631 family protein [Pleionea mediterranea]|uniref:Uncharacterized protein DUF1631 n=1 Tax=Pleionea mediterranea TaxID=523701 RepID=A0A316FHY8_9GAMM|nr:DUF1631 family protein [Pleionea mediterranea]PWK47336.1 uncharacterized protein DUF1631 [Pleionea mediterranea]